VSSGIEDASFAAQWLDVVRAPAGISLLVVYFLAAFHKLNTSFMDPAVSCAGTLARSGLRLLGVQAVIPPAAIVGIAALTIAWEFSLFVLLMVPRLRRWGVLAGVVFHAALALARFYDFSTYALAIYLLLLPADVFRRVSWPDRWRTVALAAWIGHLGITLTARVLDTTVSPAGLTWEALRAVSWTIAIGSLLGPVLRVAFSNGARQPVPPPWALRPAWLLVIPVVALVNGLTPYLGLKTVANYSMFSNLRTEEGQTNHLVPGVGRLEATSWLRDSVEIEALGLPRDPSGLTWLARLRGGNFWLSRQLRWLSEEPPIRIPWMELRRAVLMWKEAGLQGIPIGYRRNGLERTIPDAIADAELSAPMPFWAQTLLAFRAIDGDAAVGCRW
jgi:hypothetical protein